MKRLAVLFSLIAVSVFFVYSAPTSHAQALTAPVLDSAVAESACRVNLGFTPQGAASGFALKINTTGWSVISASCANGKCTFQRNLLTPKSSYTFSLRADAGGYYSDASNAKTVTMPEVQKPVAPVNLKNEWKSGGVHLVKWDAVSGLVSGGYRVYTASSESGPFTLALNPKTTDTYFVNNVPSTSPSYFTVASYQTGLGCDASGITATSDGTTGKSSDQSKVLVIPAMPSSLTATAKQGSGSWSGVVSWAGVPSADKYELEIAENSNYISPIIKTTQADTSYTLNSIGAGKTFYVRVRSTNSSNGNFGVSDYAKNSFYTGVYAPQALKASFAFEPLSTLTDVPVTLEWEDLDSNPGRKILIYSCSANCTAPANFSAIDAVRDLDGLGVPQSYTKSFPVGKTYYFKVCVSTSGSVTCSSDFSNTVAVDLTKDVQTELAGTGWGQNMGWLALKNESGAATTFGVFSDSTGVLHGNAWSPNFGWLSFSPGDVQGCPIASGGACNAQLANDGTLSGWARFRFTEETRNLPGWDGWVSLRGVDTNGANPYGLCWGTSKTSPIDLQVPDIDGTVKTHTYQTGATCTGDGATKKKVTGMAWGGPIAGWVVFGTELAVPPEVMKLIRSPLVSILAIKEQLKVSVAPLQVVDWIAELLPGSGGGVGIFNPTKTDDKTVTASTYTAPNDYNTAGGFLKGLKLIAKNTTGETASTTVSVTAPYSLTCSSDNKNKKINVTWQKQFYSDDYLSYAKHAANISFSKGSPNGPWSQLMYTANVTNSNVTISHDNPATSTPYWYKLDVTYLDGAKASVVTNDSCELSVSTTDKPSRLMVFARDNRTLYVNWKDNATSTSAYTFEVQRIKLTPSSSTAFEATSTPISARILLSWMNEATSSPHYAWIERSSSTNPLVRFTNADKYNPACSTTGDPYCMQFRGNTYSSWNGVAFVKKPDATRYYDGQVEEATTYNYRIRECSAIDPMYVTNPLGIYVINEKYRMSPACTKFSTNAQMVTTSTPPKPAIKLATTSLDAYAVGIKWTDDSKRESGFALYRNETLLHEFSPSSPKARTGDVFTYTDSTVQPGQDYTYVVRSYFEYEPGKRVYSGDIEAPHLSIATPFIVRANPTGDGSGRMTDNFNRINCPGTCEATYPADTNVVLTEEADVKSAFTGWGSPCDAPGDKLKTTCVVSRANGGVINLDAEFSRTQFALSVSLTNSDKGNALNITGVVPCSVGACSYDINRNAIVTITPVATSTYKFDSWSGDCTGSGACVVQMTGNKSVNANFVLKIVRSHGDAQANSIIHQNQNVFVRAVGLTSGRAKVFTASFVDSVSSVFQKIKTALIGAFTAWGQGVPSPYEPYFLKVTDTLTQPVLIDKNLDPDSVYLYRVRVKYGENKYSEWSNEMAGKTLDDGLTNESGIIAPICIRNSYCDFSINSVKNVRPELVIDEKSESQCKENADCANVGRKRQTTEEQ